MQVVPARTQRALLLALLTLFAVGCDSSSELEDCGYADPAAAPGSRRGACPPSVFAEEGRRSREIFGFVRRGQDAVAGATVRVEPSPGFAAGKPVAPASTVTDAVGLFLGLGAVPFRYDLLTNLDRPGSPREDVIVFRGVGSRYVEPSIEGPRSFARAWTARVDVALEPPPAPGRSVAFFASGAGVFGVSGDIDAGLSFVTREYEQPARLHVVEYETAGGLEKATAYGKVDLAVSVGAVRRASVDMERLDKTVEPKLVVLGPAGFVGSTVQIRIGVSPTSDALLATIPIGTTRKLPIIPDVGYTYQAVATAPDGRVSDTGEIGLDVYAPETTIQLPLPPTAPSPLAGDTRAAGETLVADGTGVFEHVLVPASGGERGGPSIRIVSAQREVALPDTTVVGATRAAGPYTWTVRSFPTLRFAEELGGIDARRYRPVGVSAPRTIVLR